MKTRSKMSGRESRRALAVDVSHALRSAAGDLGYSQEKLAELSGRDQPLIHRWENASEPHCPSLADVACWPAELRQAVLLRLFDDIDAEPVQDDAGHLVSLMESTALLTRGYLVAQNDGRLDPMERRALLQPALETLALVGALVNRLQDDDERVRRSMVPGGEA